MPPRDTAHFSILIYLLFVITFLSAIILLQPAWGDPGGGTAAPGEGAGGIILLGSGNSNYQLTVTPEISGWELSPLNTPSTKSGTLAVDVPDQEDEWAVTVTAEPESEGRLREYDPVGLEYAGTGKLTRPLWVKLQGGTGVDLSTATSTAQTLISGAGDATIPLTFWQEVTWNDAPLGSGHVYHTVITFDFA